MRRLEFTPRARRNIEEIWEYSFDQFGLDKADVYLRDLQRAVPLTQDPRRGLACDEIRSGYRGWRSYSVFPSWPGSTRPSTRIL